MKIDAEKLIKVLEQKKAAHKIKSFLFGDTKTDKITIKNIDDFIAIVNKMLLEEEQKAKQNGTFELELDLFDEMEIYHDCTVQVLHNTVTDEYSVGWCNNEKGA